MTHAIRQMSLSYGAKGGARVRIYVEPTGALLERLLSLTGRKELVIEAPAMDSGSLTAMGSAVLAGIIDGSVIPYCGTLEVQQADPFAFLVLDERLPFAQPKHPPLMRWAAIKPGAPWRTAR